MENEYLSRREHEEFAKRMETENHRLSDEDTRQNQRIKELETTVKQIADLTVAINSMTTSISNMTAEIKQQGERIQNIEQKPAKRWEQLVTDIIKLAVAAIFGGLVAKFGI